MSVDNKASVGEVIFHVTDLKKHYKEGAVRALNGVSMDIRRGEILSVLGENGCGKTTLMNMIAGIYYPDSGKIIINGEEVSIASPRDAYNYKIGMVHQHFKLIDVFSAAENIVLGVKDGKYNLKGANMLDFHDFPSSEKALRFFEEFSKIPRGSGNTKAIADYLVDFAKARDLECYRDASDNVVIRKAATAGYEDRPGVILQGHTDIVALKNPDCPINMEKEGLDLYRDGDLLRARGTTLGGDDGVAMAYAMAILDSDDISHPELEAVFTSDEETGLIGATALDASVLRGRLLINIDSDEEGIFTVGCAGGARVDINLPVKVKTHIGQIYTLSISGFKGGHSGVEIDKNRANAIKAMAEILSKLEDVKLGKASAGSADNAIPSDAQVIFTTKSPILEISDVINSVAETLPEGETQKKFNLEMNISSAKVIDVEASANILALIGEMPNGVMRMMEDIEGLVETSLNMGILSLDGKALNLTISVRSAKGAEKAKLLDTIKDIAEKHGAGVSVRGQYPAWEYRKESHLRDVMCKVYSDMYGKDATVVTIHAGLECGIFSDKMEGLDCVSIGPDNKDIHTPEERLSLSSFNRVYEYIINVLKNI